MQRMALLTLPIAVLLAACGAGGGGDAVASVSVNDWVEGGGPKGQVTVVTSLMWGPNLEAGPGEILPPADAYICGAVLSSYPPKCGHPIIPLLDVPDRDGLPTEFDESGVVQTGLVELTGTSDGTTITVESVTLPE